MSRWAETQGPDWAPHLARAPAPCSGDGIHQVTAIPIFITGKAEPGPWMREWEDTVRYMGKELDFEHWRCPTEQEPLRKPGVLRCSKWDHQEDSASILTSPTGTGSKWVLTFPQECFFGFGMEMQRDSLPLTEAGDHCNEWK